jgi:hypothetical protein
MKSQHQLPLSLMILSTRQQAICFLLSRFDIYRPTQQVFWALRQRRLRLIRRQAGAAGDFIHHQSFRQLRELGFS